MSHFSVLVFTTEDSLSLYELLEPYYEGNTRAPYISYTRQEAIDYARQHYDKFKEEIDRKTKFGCNFKCRSFNFLKNGI